MSAKLYGATVALPATFVAGSCDPVDSRFVVETFTDLTTNAADTFGTILDTYCKVYEGIVVYVSDEKASYMYVGPSDDSGILLTDVQTTTNWRKTSDSDTSSDAIAQSIEDLEDAIEAEATARQAADTAEASARETADNNLQSQITANKITNTDGSLTIIENSTGTTVSVKIKADNNALALDATDGLYVDDSVLTKYAGTEAISITGTEPSMTVALTIDSSDQVLTQSASGLLANLNLTWSSTDGLKLIGKNSTEIASIPATDFIKDGMLESVTMEVNPSGQSEGTYLHFVFNTDASKSDIYLNVTDLIDIYTAGNGITVASNVISVKVKEGDPVLEVTADGIAVMDEAVWDCGEY